MKKNEIFSCLGEPFAAGFFEEENASYISRHADALREHLDRAPLPEYEEGSRFYPSGRWGIWNADSGECVQFFYSFSLRIDGEALRRKKDLLQNKFDQRIFLDGVEELEFLLQSSIPPFYAVGGRGWTHAVIHYERILKEGLNGYLQRIENARMRNPEFYGALKQVLEALIRYKRRCLEYLTACGADERLTAALEWVPERTPRSFYEAFVACNFLWYVDGCDSSGRIDRILNSYRTNEPESELCELFAAFWRNVDLNDGWHALFDSHLPICKSAILGQRGYRRPNSGILIDEDTPSDVWDAVFDAWASSNPSPALYARRNYENGAGTGLGVSDEDLRDYAFGGCTELMVQGKSHVVSTDAGINLLRILSATGIRFSSYEEFYERFVADVKRHIARMIHSIRKNAVFRADYIPQLIRTLFMDDCIERGIEFNAGGVRYNGSVVNVAGLNNVVNSLVVLKRLYSGALGLSVEEFADRMDRNFSGCEALVAQLRQLPKFGNDNEEADSIAEELSALIFQYMTSFSRKDHFILPSIILFATYGPLGAAVPASPEGRLDGMPLGDSCGPVQGTDLNGPTAMLKSVLKLDQKNAPGTLVLNIRLNKKMLKDHENREKWKALFLSYFRMGGLHIQPTVADTETLKAAMKDPASYEGLIIRIGGYSEYFNRLSDDLKREVIKREEHIAG